MAVRDTKNKRLDEVLEKITLENEEILIYTNSYLEIGGIKTSIKDDVRILDFDECILSIQTGIVNHSKNSKTSHCTAEYNQNKFFVEYHDSYKNYTITKTFYGLTLKEVNIILETFKMIKCN